MSASPSAEVVIPTRGTRPDTLNQAIESVRGQQYEGHLAIAVVFDGVAPDWHLVSAGPVPVRVLVNCRTPGLAGARNSGIETSSAELVAFLDDDDFWLPNKLSRQVNWLAEAGGDFATTAIRVEFRGSRSPRLAHSSSVTHGQLVASRMSMLHSSTFLIRRQALVSAGMVDESAPLSQNEDWDLLLRFSRHHSIAHLDEPLVSVRWGSTSMFARAWESKIDAMHWIVAKHPDLRTSRVGYARLLGQMAFAQAAAGQRREAVSSAVQASRLRWREPRGYLALLAASRLLTPSLILRMLHRCGRGI
ncbi:MAG: glycosyltransferase family 2 protein [Jatrophihabitans sp.]